MRFGAMAAWQAILLVGGAAALAAALFFVKVRPPRMPVPSLLLWRRVLDESRELTLWERIRRAVSLAITVLVAAVLALALTRPGPRAGASTPGAGRTLVVLDSSWSLRARTTTGETRWERAIAEARRLVAAAAGAEVALATTGDGLVEGPTIDGALIESALERVQPGGTDSTPWPQVAGAASVHFVTDGAVARPLDRDVIVHSVYEPAPNLAVTALDVRPSLTPAHAGDAYLEIANFSRSAQTARITLTRGAARIFARDVDMGPAEVLRQVVPLAHGGEPELRLRVAGPANALDLDDEAVAWIDEAKPLAVSVVGEDTAWLGTALERNPRVRAAFTNPAGYTAGKGDAGIFVGWAPPERPSKPSLLFAPPLTTPWLQDGRPPAVENRPRWETPGSHPVVLGVDPFTLSIERARAYPAPFLVPIAQSAQGTPLVYVSETPERRLVLVTFGADESNLPGAPGFPVLIGNALDWLTNPVSASRHGIRPGLIAFDPGVARVTGPDGEVPLLRVNRTRAGVLRTPGFYHVEGGGARSTLAVNATDPQVSNLMRAPSALGAGAKTVRAGSSGRAWWIYCALAAFALVLVEWWTWQRRITV